MNEMDEDKAAEKNKALKKYLEITRHKDPNPSEPSIQEPEPSAHYNYSEDDEQPRNKIARHAQRATVTPPDDHV